MRSARLEQALEAGLWPLPPEGRIAVIRPRVGDDLSALPKDRVEVVTGFKPDADWFAGRGYAVVTRAGGGYAAAVVCLPRARAQGQALIAEAADCVVPRQSAPIPTSRRVALSVWMSMRDSVLNPHPGTPLPVSCGRPAGRPARG